MSGAYHMPAGTSEKVGALLVRSKPNMPAKMLSGNDSRLMLYAITASLKAWNSEALTDAGKAHQDRNAHLLQMPDRSDAGAQKHRGGVDRTRREDDLARRQFGNRGYGAMLSFALDGDAGLRDLGRRDDRAAADDDVDGLVACAALVGGPAVAQNQDLTHARPLERLG